VKELSGNLTEGCGVGICATDGLAQGRLTRTCVKNDLYRAFFVESPAAQLRSHRARGPPGVQKVVEISHRRAIGIRRR